MTILVTRPFPAGEALVNCLNARGQVAWFLPLIEFSSGRDLPALPQYLATLSDGDFIFILSPRAIHYAHPIIRQHGLTWPATLNYYAIGRKTALTMQQAIGHPVNYPGQQENSENLIQLPALMQIKEKRVLILRGNLGRELLAETLTKRGAKVTLCECYQRCSMTYDGASEGRRWRERKIDTLVVTSGEMLIQLYALFSEIDRKEWLLHCRLVVVSERLAMLARKSGWQKISIADRADNDALLRALR